ncbi:uncharacterized protein K452DRAFT_251529 [Neofusicoccum parvum]|uniref:Uncharacterized protein K452DRAFT_251529 n=1 Tax=Neofusicoccum parvum TaxID=310453 RepID=A0ACB5S912_9PEZI|nr:uncharacterized protein K452DRAFT_251529 [Neofusicoccum parvum]GME45111.1 uncharacterized protein K452DRAFT_251529 [Neofusicoccum parvum]
MDSLTPPEDPARSETRQPPPGRQRPKQMLSCTLCRRKKLRCSRDLPACDACSRRGLGGACTYLAPGPTIRASQHKQRTQASLNERINQLEGRIVSMMMSMDSGQQPSSIPSPAATNSPPPDLGDSFGHLRLDADGTKYVAGDHWTAILDGIAELKDELSTKESKHSGDSTVLLLSSTSSASREEILAAVPVKPVVDALVDHYFRVTSFASILLHGPTFLKQYELFWSNHDAMPVMWIGLLFTVMAHGLHLRLNRSPDPHALTSGREELENYVEKAAQCLFLADYTRSVPFTMETLLLYVSVEIHRSPETIPGHSILSAIVVRVAMRMGYHRDPSHSPQITPFQAEMRRRHWAFVRTFDMHASAEFGLPRMINESACDTKEPLNIIDDDLSENMTEPPQPRSSIELTPMLFLAARNKIMSVFGSIVDLTTSTHSASYQTLEASPHADF